MNLLRTIHIFCEVLFVPTVIVVVIDLVTIFGVKLFDFPEIRGILSNYT